MDKETFLLNDYKKEIESSFIKDGWLTIKRTIYKNNDDQTIYCCLVDEKRIKSYRQNSDWKIEICSEGKPSVFGDGKYQTYADKGIEPFIFSKHFNFNGGHESYSDISEEFILYFRLYEKGESKQNRTFNFIDDVGDLDEVILITPNEIKIKLKYLNEIGRAHV